MNHKDNIYSLIEKEKDRQLRGLELIASENFVSSDILNVIGSILTNKYAEGYPNKRYYGGCEIIDKIEQIAINRAKKLFKANYANVQSHSGSQANTAVYLASIKPGDIIMGFDLSHGGHLTHGASVNFSGSIYRSIFYGLNKETGLIDYEKMSLIAIEKKPKLIICGASAYSRDIDYKKFREVADYIGSILVADIAHTAGLIVTGLLNHPFPHCNIITSTTHKTLRGPRGGLILVGNDFEHEKSLKKQKMSQLIDKAVFPGCQGGPFENIIAAKAIAFKEAMTKEYLFYAKQIIRNAKALSKSLMDKGYNIISGGTDNHCILVDLRNKNITGKEAENILVTADITCNKNMVPFDNKSPLITSGIRIGTAAITTRGLKENDMENIANWINEVIINKSNNLKIKNIKNEINNFMKNYPLFNNKILN
ncbi:MAG: serine hydroxymethyltransferase [Candidatus Bostrichicola ureolyticus]|nr:MAG: serine hydroxymethyltransferase [Candidatus Bostrichicola ureolyticus]